MNQFDPYYFLDRPEHMARGSLANHVADVFREAIVSLKLRPGTMLDKGEICVRLGISRSPVAEAMARLQAEGLIEIRPQRGTIVSLVSIQSVKEYIFVRRALEGETVRMLAQSPPEGLIAALQANLEEQRVSAETNDRLAFHRLDVAFHEMLLNGIGYKRMKAMVDTARNNLDRARQLTNSARRIGTGIEEHMQIVEAIAQGRDKDVVALMHHHLDGVVTEVYRLARECPQLFSDGNVPLAILDEAR